jgi:hypothetical protein
MIKKYIIIITFIYDKSISLEGGKIAAKDRGFLLGFRLCVTRRFRCSTRGIKDQVSWGTLDESVNASRTDLNNDLNAASKLL